MSDDVCRPTGILVRQASSQPPLQVAADVRPSTGVGSFRPEGFATEAARRTVTAPKERFEELTFCRRFDDLDIPGWRGRAACRALEEHNYALSLMTSWVTAERLLSARWHEYMTDNRVRAGSPSSKTEDRRRFRPHIHGERISGRRSGGDVTAATMAIPARLDARPVASDSRARWAMLVPQCAACWQTDQATRGTDANEESLSQRGTARRTCVGASRRS